MLTKESKSSCLYFFCRQVDEHFIFCSKVIDAFDEIFQHFIEGLLVVVTFCFYLILFFFDDRMFR